MARTRWIVSVKGVVLSCDQVLLALNDRSEWELPGGQLENGETLEGCVEREILEETGLTVTAARLLRSWVYQVVADTSVVIVAYRCHVATPDQAPVTSAEHSRVEFMPLAELDTINLPSGYLAAIEAATLD